MICGPTSWHITCKVLELCFFCQEVLLPMCLLAGLHKYYTYTPAVALVCVCACLKCLFIRCWKHLNCQASIEGRSAWRHPLDIWPCPSGWALPWKLSSIACSCSLDSSSHYPRLMTTGQFSSVVTTIRRSTPGAASQSQQKVAPADPGNCAFSQLSAHFI